MHKSKNLKKCVIYSKPCLFSDLPKIKSMKEGGNLFVVDIADDTSLCCLDLQLIDSREPSTLAYESWEIRKATPCQASLDSAIYSFTVLTLPFPVNFFCPCAKRKHLFFFCYYMPYDRFLKIFFKFIFILFMGILFACMSTTCMPGA